MPAGKPAPRLVAVTTALCVLLAFEGATNAGEGKTPPSCRQAHIASCEAQASKPQPPGNLDAVGPLRRSIVEAAIGELGVTWAFQGPDCYKTGWRNLQSYYEVATGTPVKAHNLRVLKRAKTEQGPKEHYVFQDWCAIFGLWAVKSGAQRSLSRAQSASAADTADGCAQTPVMTLEQTAQANKLLASLWTQGPSGGTITGMKFHAGTTGMQPGDIAAIADKPGETPLSHHALVERIVGGRVYSIDGNSECQGVTRHDRAVGDVAGYWSLE